MSDITALHYVGYDTDEGGIVSVIRRLASQPEFASVLGVNRGFRFLRKPELEREEFSPLQGEVVSPRSFWRARRVAREVATWLAADPRRIYHGHSRAGLWVGWNLVRAGQSRVVLSVHCYGRQRAAYRWLNRRMPGKIFWLTPAMRAYYGVEGEGWDRCVPPCVDLPPAAPAFRRPRGPLLVLGGVGSLVAWKRWDLVLEALDRIPVEQRRSVRFVHIGGPIDSSESRSFAEKLKGETAAKGLSELVSWRGPQASSAPLLAEIDALIVASHQEPCSVALLEALAAGVPVLASNTGGSIDIVRPGRNGWFFRDGEPDDLARQILALQDPAAWSNLENGSAELDRFSTPRVAQGWRRIYEEALRR